MVKKFVTIIIVTLLWNNNSNAQLCQGSLGDPIINITFGNGANPGAPLSAATTSYQYASNDCPNDGFYTVRNNTLNCFNSTWHTVNADHTGDANGYFMLINASVQPGAFYLDTVRGLCGNTTYEFAAWIMNVLTPTSCSGAGIQPNVTFSIEQTNGTILQSFNTNNISSSVTPTWNQYGFFFTTPAALTDIVLRMVNNAPGGCGNDLALDDITFRPCGPLITGTIDGQPISSKEFCEGTQQTFLLSCTTNGGFANPQFQWQTKSDATSVWTDIAGANTNSYLQTFSSNTAAGIYQFRLAVAQPGNINSMQCRVYSQSFNFTINQLPATTANNNGPVCERSVATLNSSRGTQYQWSGPGGFNSNNSTFTFNNTMLSQAGKYYVTVTNSANCSRRDSTTLVVNPSPIATTNFADTTICEGDSVQLLAEGGTAFIWTPVSGLSSSNIYNPKASPSKTTLYNVIVSNQFGCSDSANTTIHINPKPTANAGPDKIIFKGQSVQLSGMVNGVGSYSWSPPTDIDNVNSLQPIVNPASNRNYILSFFSSCGTSTDTVLVKVFNGIYIPNAFSPNGDNINDTWNILGLEACPNFEVLVYDRWGQLVFHIKDNIKGWDGMFKGKLLPVGTYVYSIKTCNSTNLMKGIVLLLK